MSVRANNWPHVQGSTCGLEPDPRKMTWSHEWPRLEPKWLRSVVVVVLDACSEMGCIWPQVIEINLQNSVSIYTGSSLLKRTYMHFSWRRGTVQPDNQPIPLGLIDMREPIPRTEDPTLLPKKNNTPESVSPPTFGNWLLSKDRLQNVYTH